MMKKILLILLLFPSICFAAGPDKLAKSDRSLWPNPINTPEGFDEASIYEAMAFVNVFNAIENSLNSEVKLRKFTGLKDVSVTSVEKYKKNIKNTISQKHDMSWEELSFQAEEYHHLMPEDSQEWYKNAQEFYNNYIYEQLRLAALFPRISSEIDVFDKSEIQGFEMKDKHFILTFDDGPSPKDGNTDKLIKTLKDNDKKAIFFILGDNFVKRSDVKELYKDFLVESHGKEHKAHTKPEFYEQSLIFNLNKINESFPNQEKCYFRPPYGQRTPETVDFLKQKNCQVMLWNIDSQDWSAKMASKEVKDRVITLMLLWRSGIILFHDIHPKANEILPEIWKDLQNSGVVFDESI